LSATNTKSQQSESIGNAVSNKYLTQAIPSYKIRKNKIGRGRDDEEQKWNQPSIIIL
jgi:hypothetical protein